jgi:hypothetical protein
VSDATLQPTSGRRLALAICAGRWPQSFVLPSYTPDGWFECDVFEVTRAGYFREYEAKVSKSDFNRDAGKRLKVYPIAFGAQATYENKHELLAGRAVRGPQRFWYVTPVGLLETVPSWAGLIEISQDRYGHLRETERVPAPALHKIKLDSQVLTHARGMCYYRMWRLAMKGFRDSGVIDEGIGVG